MNEVVNSIQMIKFYAWESSFKAAVMEVRAKEAGILKRMIWWQALFTMLLFSGPVMMAVAVFAVYAATGHVFNAATGECGVWCRQGRGRVWCCSAAGAGKTAGFAGKGEEPNRSSFCGFVISSLSLSVLR
jgi:hypothetical protein